jgi:hypothetical protein
MVITTETKWSSKSSRGDVISLSLSLSLSLSVCFHLEEKLTNIQVTKRKKKLQRRRCSFHFQASEVEHGCPESQEAAALAVCALGEPQAAAEADAGLPLHRLHHHGLFLGREADAEVQIDSDCFITQIYKDDTSYISTTRQRKLIWKTNKSQ